MLLYEEFILENKNVSDLIKNSALNRYAYITGKQYTLGGLGSLVGALGGGLYGYISGKSLGDDEHIKDHVYAGALAGALGGYITGAAYGGYNAAKDLGYGKVGRIAAATLGGVAGLFKPKGNK